VYYNRSVSRTAAASFTLPAIYHYYAQQSVIGAGSTVNSQYGYTADSSLTGATNNFGFYGDLAAATGRWNLYMNGTANNYMAGALGINSTALTGYSLRVDKNLTGATTAFGVYSGGQINSDVTSTAYLFRTRAFTQAASFTLGNLIHYSASNSGLGAGSAITNQFGFIAEGDLTQATNNYGFYGGITAATGRWNFYAAGTAANYFNGNTLIGSTSDTGEKLQVTGTAKITGGLTTNLVTSTLNANTYISLTGGGGAFIDYRVNNADSVRFSSTGLFIGSATTPTAILDISASVTARASLRIRSGTAPTTPNDGDIWFDGTDLKMRIGGVTKTFTLV
jgi:hypothetical protein